MIDKKQASAEDGATRAAGKIRDLNWDSEIEPSSYQVAEIIRKHYPAPQLDGNECQQLIAIRGQWEYMRTIDLGAVDTLLAIIDRLTGGGK